jgi:hypothetical protein
MTIRTSRDWRGIKHKLSEYSTHELASILNNAEHTRAQLDSFIGNVAAELTLRQGAPKPSAG